MKGEDGEEGKRRERNTGKRPVSGGRSTQGGGMVEIKKSVLTLIPTLHRGDTIPGATKISSVCVHTQWLSLTGLLLSGIMTGRKSFELSPLAIN